MLDSYPVIFFDAGGTLFRPFPSVGHIYSEVALRHGCEADPLHIEERFKDLWHRQDAMAKLVSHSDEKIERDWWRILVAAVFDPFTGLRDFDVFFDELYREFAEPRCWRLFPETFEVLASLKKRNKRLGIISNWDSRLIPLCDGLGIRNYFDFILISAVYGASKPNPKIFREALRLAGAEPGNAVHVGDSIEDDIKGARGIGMHAVLIDRHKRKHSDPASFDGYPVVHDLKELL